MNSDEYKTLAHDIRKHLTIIKSEATIELKDEHRELKALIQNQVDAIANLLSKAIVEG